jgi:hypothetical protein
MHFHALPTETVRALQSGAPDAHGDPCERTVSDGIGTPCRHCLMDVPAGAGMLILAHRPFATLHPYAECGPIFLCADACGRGGDDGALPAILRTSPEYLVKAYDRRERIIYGTGAIVPSDAIAARAGDLLEEPEVAFVDVRSARNNCFLTRITRNP